jgi:ribosomal protein S18 acetylase RimI-like enzyme
MVIQIPYFKKITFNEIDEVKNILLIAGNSLESFRYYQNRDFNAINNHVITVLLTDNHNRNISYGHIDFDGSTYWLGIMVIESEVGHGWGRKMMAFLIEFCDNNDIVVVKLTVDKSNLKAIDMYKKFGFQIVEEFSNTSFLMVREKIKCL